MKTTLWTAAACCLVLSCHSDAPMAPSAGPRTPLVLRVGERPVEAVLLRVDGAIDSVTMTGDALVLLTENGADVLARRPAVDAELWVWPSVNRDQPKVHVVSAVELGEAYTLLDTAAVRLRPVNR